MEFLAGRLQRVIIMNHFRKSIIHGKGKMGHVFRFVCKEAGIYKLLRIAIGQKFRIFQSSVSEKVAVLIKIHKADDISLM